MILRGHQDPRQRGTPCRGRRHLLRIGLAALCVPFATARLARGASLPPPSGEILLTITGKIRNTNGRSDGREAAHFDRAMLEALGQRELRTTTAWTKDTHDFEGVSASALLARVGAYGDTALATALNDYQVQIPLSDFHDYPVLLAFKQDGRYLRVRDKGPIWMVYPATDYNGLNTPEMQTRWVWQLRRLEIR